MNPTVDTLSEFLKFTKALAQALGGAVVRAPTNENCWYATISTADLPLTLSQDRNTGKLKVGIDWPTYTDQNGGKTTVTARDVLDAAGRQNPPATDINVTMSRGADAVAKDVIRRLMPSATPVYVLAQQACFDRAAYATTKAATIARLAKALKGNVRGETVHTDVAELRVNSADSIDFRYLSVDADTAIKLIQLLRGSKKS